MLESTGASSIENISAPSSANATVQAMGLNKPAFHALQSEDRQIGRDDDADRIKHGPLHFVRGLADLLHRGPGSRLVVPAKMAHDVLHHHHRAIHDHAEIERAERQQVRRNMSQVETDRGEQQRKRNGQSDDQRAADIAQKQEQDDRLPG